MSTASVTVTLGQLCGDVEDGYGAVADAFRRNFVERREVGAPVATYQEGEKVVDLWGGVRDRASGEPWREDTAVPSTRRRRAWRR